jgi:uncharacterized protein
LHDSVVVSQDAGNLVFALSAAFDTVIVCAALVWAGRRRRPWVWVTFGSAAVLFALAAKGVLLTAAGVQIPFGVLHVLWLDLVVVLPLAGAAVLLVARRGRARGLAPIAALALLLAPVGVYASFIEPGRLSLESAELELPEARSGRKPLRVGVLADLQFEHLGSHERSAAKRLQAERPDVILLAGDYHQGSAASFRRELPALKRLLRGLDAPGGVYAVQGDCEGMTRARRALAGTGVRLLANQIVRLPVRDRTVTLAGVELRWSSPAATAAIDRLERSPGQGDVRLLLAHRPDAVRSLSRPSRVDLLVAGHTHGGQVQLPLIGPPHTASSLPRSVGAGGLHDLDGRRLYISRGVGVERGQAPKLRIGAVPEVSVITLR